MHRAALLFNKLLALSLFLFAPLLGCAAPAAHADWERSADFSPGKTFAITASDELSQRPTARQKALIAIVHTTIERELVHKGYVKAPPDSARLLVSFYPLRRMRQEVTVKQSDCYARDRGELPPGTPWEGTMIACEESLVTEYEEGTLIIDIYDAEQEQLIWHGWKSDKALPPDSAELPALAERATVDILSNFPPD